MRKLTKQRENQILHKLIKDTYLKKRSFNDVVVAFGIPLQKVKKLILRKGWNKLPIIRGVITPTLKTKIEFYKNQGLTIDEIAFLLRDYSLNITIFDHNLIGEISVEWFACLIN